MLGPLSLKGHLGQSPCANCLIIYLQCSILNRRDWGSLPSKYPIVQWLEPSPEVADSCSNCFSPQDEGDLNQSSSTMSTMVTKLKVMREVIVMLPSPLSCLFFVPSELAYCIWSRTELTKLNTYLPLLCELLRLRQEIGARKHVEGGCRTCAQKQMSRAFLLQKHRCQVSLSACRVVCIAVEPKTGT